MSVYLGQRSLDENDYEPVEDQITFGSEFSQEFPDSVVGWETGVMGSADSEDVGPIGVSAITWEFYAGVRKSFGSATVRPYVGAGLSVIGVAVDTDFSDEDHDTSLGFYAHGGLNFQITPLFSLGADLRGLFGTDVQLYGIETDADYVQLALVGGFSF